MKKCKKLIPLVIAASMMFQSLTVCGTSEVMQTVAEEYSQSQQTEAVTDENSSLDEQIAENTTEDAAENTISVVEDEMADVPHTLSLLPLEEENVEVLLDRTAGIPAELEGQPKYSFTAREIVKAITGSEDYNGQVVYSQNIKDEESTPNLAELDEIITITDDLTSVNHSTYGFTDYYRLEFVIGNDQLNADSIIYNATIYFKYEDDTIARSNFAFLDKYGNEILPNGSGNLVKDSVNVDGEEYSYFSKMFYFPIYDFDVEANVYPYFKMDSNADYNITLYDGHIYDESDIASAVEITDEWCEMELLDSSVDYADYKFCFKQFTVATESDDGSISLTRFRLVASLRSNLCSFGFTADSSEYKYEYIYISDNSSEYTGKSARAYTEDSFDDVEVKVRTSYYDYNGAEHGEEVTAESNSKKIKYACYGKYDTAEAALNSGKTDIKDQLFNRYGYMTVDFSEVESVDAYMDYNDKTPIPAKKLSITVVDIYGMVYSSYENYFVLIEEESEDEDEDEDEDESGTYYPPSENTYFSVFDSDSVSDDNGSTSYVRSYKVSSDNDSYCTNGYQTLFLLESVYNDSTYEYEYYPVTSEYIIPWFSQTSSAKVYIGNDFAAESGTEPLQISGRSRIKFVPGKAIQYSVSSYSGINMENYWVTFETIHEGEAKLFVNAVNNPDHFNSEGLPQREMYLKTEEDYHDIFFANIGDRELTGIDVALSDDTTGVKLDDYWTVVDDSVGTLAPFTKTYDAKNIAKLRLVPIDDSFAPITGTLSITTANGGNVDIALTGVAGTPKIVTDKLYDGVKYVPYSCVIMTNSMYENDAMEFSVSEGKLPKGMELLPNGELYGIPEKSGTFTFTVKAEYTGTGTKDGEKYVTEREYTLVIADNTDENVDAVNEDEQGYTLTERVSRDITIYYNGTTNAIDRVEYDDYIFHSEGKYTDEFVAFYLDGEELTKGIDYIAEDGSTKITVRDETFKKITNKSGTIPHTLAAEFRTENKEGELRRSAQNIYVKYEMVSGTDSDSDTGDNTDGNGGNNNGGNNSSNSGTVSSANNNTANGSSSAGNAAETGSYVSAVITIVDAEGNPIPDLSIELRSKPQYATTDSTGTVKFDKVEFGRHKLYITDPETGKKAVKSFSLVSGRTFDIDDNVITAVKGEKLFVAVKFSGSDIEFTTVAEDVSADSAAYSVGTALDIAESDGYLHKIAVVCMTVILLAAAVIIAVRKNKAQ